jgi:hypothetical protein
MIVSCGHCGQSFSKPPSEVKRSLTAPYCSLKCHGLSRAASVLGLTPADAQELFYPYDLEGPDGDWRITRAQAIRVLEHLRDTGEVDWSKRGRR